MIVLRTKIRGFKANTLRNVGGNLATNRYFKFEKREGRDVKIIVTKKNY